MPDVTYRIELDGKAATRAQLDQFDEIAVEQAVDMAWEARLKVAIVTDANGKWTGENESFLKAFTRLRLEVRVGAGGWTPLIDGPVIGADHDLTSQPGRSTVTVIVQDDSVYLNRRDTVSRFEDRLDHEIADQLFRDAAQIARRDIETTTAAPTGLPAVEVQRGTPMQILRRLARRHGMYAYVLPGETAGGSVGVFKRLPTRPSGLPEIVLLGGKRNVVRFTVKNDAQSPADVEAYSLNITDKTVTKGVARLRNVELLGDAAPVGHADAGVELLPGEQDGAVDPTARAEGAAARRSFSFEASGMVAGDCYGGVLAPYKVVTVTGVNGRLSGDYVLKTVSHRLTRSLYTQAFSLMRNAQSQGAGGDLENLAGAIF